MLMISTFIFTDNVQRIYLGMLRLINMGFAVLLQALYTIDIDMFCFDMFSDDTFCMCYKD